MVVDMTELSGEQLAGIEEIKKWYADAADGLRHPVFRLFGPAGTGKTTMAKSIPPALGTSARFMTFTGKAAHVLGTKGVPAKTIHSSIYYPLADEEAKKRLQEARQELADMETVAAKGTWEAAGFASPVELSAHMDQTREEVEELEARSRRMSWEWNPEAFAQDNPGLLVLDEVSMVNSKLAGDLEAFGIPILVLGDPAQLPPVEGGGYYTEGQPDYMLETIHRQALESPVLSLATRIRLSQGRGLGITHADTVPASVRDAMTHEQVITWSNKRRWAMISAMRKVMGFPEGTPVKGDRIMCLSNNKDLAVFNGQQFTVLDSKPTPLGPTLTLADDAGHERTIPTFQDGFMGLDLEKQAKGSGAGYKGGRMLATFGQAITCHKAQGSEWKSVYVVNELPSMMWMEEKQKGAKAAEAQGRRWLYTAVTRASEKVTISAPSNRGR
jgi:exodeoxyribonuclease V